MTLENTNNTALDSTTFGLFQQGPNPGVVYGLLAPHVSSYPSVSWLQGQTVSLLADGGVQHQVAGSSSIPVSPQAGFVTAGLPYSSNAQLLRFDAGSGNGTRMGKHVRTHRLGVAVSNSLDVYVGFDGFGNKVNGDPFLHLPDEMKRQASANLSVGPPLFSGIISTNTEADSNLDNFVCLQSSGPFPATIQAVMPQMDTQDRA